MAAGEEGAYCAGDEACSIGVCGRREKKFRLRGWEGRRGLKEEGLIPWWRGSDLNDEGSGCACPTINMDDSV